MNHHGRRCYRQHHDIVGGGVGGWEMMTTRHLHNGVGDGDDDNIRLVSGNSDGDDDASA